MIIELCPQPSLSEQTWVSFLNLSTGPWGTPKVAVLVFGV